MNASKYKGIPPYQTPAQRQRRYLVATIGLEAVEAQERERVDYYRSLLAKVRANSTR